MFKIGDKVEHEKYGNGVVQLRDLYRIHFDGEVKHLLAEDLKPVAKYSVGETVSAYGKWYVVLSEVFADTDGTRSYVLRSSSTGDCHLLPESDIRK